MFQMSTTAGRFVIDILIQWNEVILLFIVDYGVTLPWVLKSIQCFSYLTVCQYTHSH